MNKAIDAGYNTFGIQCPNCGCVCFIGNNPDYDRYGRASNCNAQLEGGGYANNVFFISGVSKFNMKCNGKACTQGDLAAIAVGVVVLGVVIGMAVYKKM